jgi:two-component sensor histidine kinase
LPDGDEFPFEWEERDGPIPIPPARDGFGSRLIKSVTTRERAGRVTIDYAPHGLHCRMTCQLPKVA